MRYGLFDDWIVGSCFFDGNLTGKRYVEILRDVVGQFACHLPLQDLRRTWFQHHGVSLHFSAPARDRLSENFPDRWTGWSRTIFGPPRSPDLTTIDCFLWEYVSSQLYVADPSASQVSKNHWRMCQHTEWQNPQSCRLCRATRDDTPCSRGRTVWALSLLWLSAL